MLSCAICGKQNLEHYRFCLGCGADISGQTRVPKAASPKADPPAEKAGISVHVFPPSDDGEALPLQRPLQPAQNGLVCPSCNSVNESDNRYCVECGEALESFRPSLPPPLYSKPVEGVSEPPPSSESTDNMSGIYLTALEPDGSEAGWLQLPYGTTIVGRAAAAIFEGDDYLSPRHASFTPRGERVLVRDEGSLNGVYRRIEAHVSVRLESGQIFRIGQELIRYEGYPPPAVDEQGVQQFGSPRHDTIGRIVMVLGRHSEGTSFPVPARGLHLGREQGEVLFADDGYVSGKHCALQSEEGEVHLTDLGSSNGTFVRIQEGFVDDGDILLMGQQLFRIST